MKAASRPLYYRIKRIVDIVREGSERGHLLNRGGFRRELEVSPRTLARDSDFLCDQERAPRFPGIEGLEKTFERPKGFDARRHALSVPSYPRQRFTAVTHNH